MTAVGVASLLLLGLVLEFRRPINHDVAWTLEAAEADSDGRILYRDVLEVNPPLIFWFAGRIEEVARALHLPPHQVYRIATVFLVVLAAIALWQLAPEPHRQGAAVLLLLLTLVGVGWDFGQREHLIVLLLAPFIAMCARADGTRRRVVIAATLCGALATCLKPQYAIVAAAPALLLLRGRRLLLAVGTATAVGIAYAASVLSWAPDYSDAVDLLGPLYVKWANQPLTALLVHPAVFVPVLLAALGLLDFRHRTRWELAWLAAALASAAVALLQGKGFHYHYLPAISFGVLAAHAMRASPHGRAAALLASLTLIPLAEPIWKPGVRSWRASLGEAAAAFAAERPGSSIVAITPALPDIFPAVSMARLSWEATFPNVWWPFVDVQTPAARHRADSLTSLLIADVVVGRPDLVAFELPDLARRRRPGAESLHELLLRTSTLGLTLQREYEDPVNSGPFLIYRRMHVERTQ